MAETSETNLPNPLIRFSIKMYETCKTYQKHDHSDPWNHLEPYPGMPSIRGLQIQLRLAHHCGVGYQPMECSGGEHGGSQHGLVLAMHIWQDSVLSLEYVEVMIF